MLSFIYAAADARLGARLENDLQEAGLQPSRELFEGAQHILLVLLSPQSIDDPALQKALYHALDSGQHLVPLLAKDMPLPKLIDHLAPIDLSRYDAQPVIVRVRMLKDSPANHMSLKVLTPRAQAANRRFGLALGLLALIMAVLGMLLIASGTVAFPREEYNTVATIEMATINAEIRPELQAYATLLPNSTEAAAQYPATLRAIPTIYRPYVAATATAEARRQP
ncbi:MAG: toll/interleukin-1 receptor domain-containing protein [Chloroflexi bacterium]|nr:toll/interleukin-1 receptor domain-containing protein [Chloroflexota bacterium]